MLVGSMVAYGALLDFDTGSARVGLKRM